MRRRILRVALAAALALGVAAPMAQADFGVESFSAQVRNTSTPGDLDTQAGSHPFEGVTDFTFKTNGLGMPDGNVKNIRVDLPPGIISNPEATPRCTEAQFPDCPAATKLGTETLTAVMAAAPPVTVDVFNMVTKPGQVSLFSFNAPVFGRTDIVGGLRAPGDYGLFFTISNVPENSSLVRSILTFYGTPADRNGGGGPHTPFLTLPTSCGPPSTTTLTAEPYAGKTVTVTDTTPTGATGCDKLPFAPEIEAVATGRTSRANGAGLSVAVSQATGEANIKSVSVQLPKQFAARNDTLGLVCPDTTFNVDPESCGEGSRVGSALAATPLLANPLSGTAFLVGHPPGLPTIEALLKGPGITVDLSGTITLGATGITSAFESVPDLPISRFVLNLPAGPHSALGTGLDLCAGALTVPSTIVAQSGAQQVKTFPMTVADCPVAVVGKAKVKGHTGTLRLRVPSAGTLTVSGSGLKKVKRTVAAKGRTTAKLGLSKTGLARLRAAHRKHKKLSLRATVKFVPAAAAQGTPSKTRKTLVFK